MAVYSIALKRQSGNETLKRRKRDSPYYLFCTTRARKASGVACGDEFTSYEEAAEF
jgi:hypothetical protein